jgi:hypothetical protein
MTFLNPCHEVINTNSMCDEMYCLLYRKHPIFDALLCKVGYFCFKVIIYWGFLYEISLSDYDLRNYLSLYRIYVCIYWLFRFRRQL